MADNIQSNQTGVTLPYEKVAMSGGEMPDGLKSHDKWMFLCLRMLYGQVRHGMVDRVTAVTEKRKLLEEYRVLEFQNGNQDRMIEAWKKAETAASGYRLNPTIENADKVLEALYGVKRKEQK